jgi:hypothetical protein
MGASMADIQSQADQKSAFTDEEIAAVEKEADKCGDRFTTAQLLGKQGTDDRSSGGYQVVWLPSARSRVEQSASGSTQPVNSAAVQSVNELLAESPSQHGNEVLGRARLAKAGSWQVLYRVDEPDKLVTVLGVKMVS